MIHKTQFRKRAIALTLILFPILTSGQINKTEAIRKSVPTTNLKSPQVPDHTILQSDENGLVVEFYFPHFTTGRKEVEAKTYHFLTIPGCSHSSDAGKPQLPVKGFLFGIPPAKQATVEVSANETNRLAGFTVYPAPKILEPRDEKTFTQNFQDQTIQSEFFIDDVTYQANKLYPSTLVKTLPTVQFRHQIVGTIQVYPIQFNPGNGTIQHHKKITVKINFVPDGSMTGIVESAAEINSPFEPILKNNLINFSAAQLWGTKRKSPPSIRKSGSFHSSEPAYKIFVQRDGIYYISWQRLEQAGIDIADIDPQNLKIFFQGNEIPIYVHGEGDHVFDESDYIEFYGKKCRNDFTFTNVYWLTWDNASPGKRMAGQDGSVSGSAPKINSARQTVHFETENYYFTAMPNGEGQDHWFWDYFIAPTSDDLSFELKHVADTTAEDCSVEIEFFGYADAELHPDHHTVVSLNNTQFLDDKWDGAIRFNNSFSFTQSLLKEGANTITLRLPGDTGANSDIIYMNFYTVTFWQKLIAQNDSLTVNCVEEGPHQLTIQGFTNSAILVYDITDEFNTKRINNISVSRDSSKYNVAFENTLAPAQQILAIASWKRIAPEIVRDEPSQLAETEQQADYIFITHEDFSEAILPLQEFRRNRGLNTTIVKISDIYDEFNYGIKDPRAIRDFLSHAFHNWQAPAPAYVLLVGDACYDPKNYQGTGHPDLMPAHLFESRHYNTETASDNWFACVAGQDNIPEMFIGRLPAKSVEETELLVSRIIDYENAPVESDWNRRVLFFADDDDETEHFAAYSDSLIAWTVPQDYSVETMYLNDYTDLNLARSDLIGKFNNGSLVANYFGHGSLVYLAGEKILQTSDIPKMDNANRQPFFLSLSCLNGFFHHAQLPNCLAEALVKGESGGAIGCLAPSGFAISNIMGYLAEEMYTGLFRDNEARLGELSVRAKLGILKNTEYYRDHIDFYNLFGDPALRLKIDSLQQEVYASYSGQLLIREDPAPIDTELRAWINGVDQPVKFHVHTSGRYGPVQIFEDDPTTPHIDGAAEGDSIRFEVVTVEGDTIPVPRAVKWNCGQHLIDLVAREEIITSVKDMAYQIEVDSRIYGIDFFDGDPLFKNSPVEICFSQQEFELNFTNTRFLLNNELTDNENYAFIQNEAGKDFNQKVVFPLEPLEDGRYSLRLELENPNTSAFEALCEFSFHLVSSLTLDRVLNFPNPMTEHTTFTYVLANDNPAAVQIKIYTLAGRLIKAIEPAPGDPGYNQVPWSGRDENNDAIANGVYFYKIIARSGDNSAERIDKLVIMR